MIPGKPTTASPAGPEDLTRPEFTAFIATVTADMELDRLAAELTVAHAELQSLEDLRRHRVLLCAR